MKSNSKPIIRIASRADIPQIAAWQVAMALETESMRLDLDVVTRGVTHVFDHPEIGHYLLAEIYHRPAACCLVLSEWSDWRNGAVLWIHSVYVEAAHRQSKVFSAIYATLREQVEANPTLRGLRLYVDKTNVNAIRCYERLGMAGDHYHLFEWMK